MNPLIFDPQMAQALAAALFVDLPQQIYNTAKVPSILVDNYMQLRQMNKMLGSYSLPKSGTDTYYHQKAQSEMAKLGTLPMLTGQMLGLVKEIFDIPKNLVCKKVPIDATIRDFVKDLTENVEGASMTKSELQEARSDGMKQLYRALGHEN